MSKKDCEKKGDELAAQVKMGLEVNETLQRQIYALQREIYTTTVKTRKTLEMELEVKKTKNVKLAVVASYNYLLAEKYVKLRAIFDFDSMKFSVHEARTPSPLGLG